jgi:hypothetical protein
VHAARELAFKKHNATKPRNSARYCKAPHSHFASLEYVSLVNAGGLLQQRVLPAGGLTPLLTRVSENILLADRLACEFHATLRKSNALGVSEIYSVSLTIFTFPVTPSEIQQKLVIP